MNDEVKAEEYNLEGAAILITDDDPVIRMVYSRILKRWNAQVFLATTGKEAIACSEEHDIAVVLMDVHLPDMSGFETARRLGNILRYAGKRLPVIALTSARLDDIRSRMAAADMSGFLDKACDPAALYSMLKKLAGCEETTDTVRRLAS